MSVGTPVWQSAFFCFLLDGSSTVFTFLKHTNENTGFKCSSCYQFLFQKSHLDLNSNPWISLCCAETGESICDVRPGTSEDSTHLVEFVSLLILTTFVFFSLSSSIWKAESLSTDAGKEYNRCKKDITLLIVLIKSNLKDIAI